MIVLWVFTWARRCLFYCPFKVHDGFLIDYPRVGHDFLLEETNNVRHFYLVLKRKNQVVNFKKYLEFLEKVLIAVKPS
jgi:hypothetical protein